MAEPCLPIRAETLDVHSPSASPMTAEAVSAWYAVQVAPRHEKRVATKLHERRLTTFLPLVQQVRQWSDRKKLVDLPLFPGYTFARLATLEHRVAVLRTQGVVRVVGRGAGTPIPDKQLDDIRRLLSGDVLLDPHPFIKVGDRVRIRGGYLDGVEGLLVRKDSFDAFVISIDLLNQSVATRVHGFSLEKI